LGRRVFSILVKARATRARSPEVRYYTILTEEKNSKARVRVGLATGSPRRGAGAGAGLNYFHTGPPG
jgi:hypothetical protein